MDKYVATAERGVKLSSGVVELTDEQARTRMHNLEKVGKKGNKYKIVNAVQFKFGEEFGYEGEVNKALAQSLTSKKDADDAAAKAAAEAEVAAKKAAAEAAKLEEQRKALEEMAKADWDASENLREEHAGDFDAYLASVLEQVG